MKRQVVRKTGNGPRRRQQPHLDIARRLEFALPTDMFEPFSLQRGSQGSPSTITGGKSGSEQHDQHKRILRENKRRIKQDLPSGEGGKTTGAHQRSTYQKHGHAKTRLQTW